MRFRVVREHLVRKSAAFVVFVALWICTLYVLWLMPSGLGQHVSGAPYGFFGPIRSQHGDFWLPPTETADGRSAITFHEAGVILTLVLTFFAGWLDLSIYYSIAKRRPLSLRLWRSRAERRIERGQCPKCGYTLGPRMSEGCSECGWHRV